MKRFDIQALGGVCAIAYTVLVVVFFALFLGSDLAEVDTAAEFLPVLDDARATGVAVSVFLIVLPLLLAVAGLGFYRMVQHAGSMTWLAAFGFVGGGVAILYRGFTWLAMTLHLAPAYAAAGAREQTTLAVVGDTLQTFAVGADMVGGVLIGGVGVLIVSIALLRERIGPRWIAWLGIGASFVGGWSTLVMGLSEVLAMINFLGTVGFFVWMVAVGILACRRPPPPIDARAA